jgi:hypothetical protein
MAGRGTYGRTLLGAVPRESQGSSYGAWLIGAIVAGGAVLWAKHQSNQIEKLYATAGLPYEGFARSLSARTHELSSAAREKFQGFAQRLGARKELKDG